MARPRTSAAEASATEVGSASSRAEDDRMQRCEESLARLVDLEDRIRAQRDIVDEATGHARALAVRVLGELQAGADEEMLRLNALRLEAARPGEASPTPLRSARWVGAGGLAARAAFIGGLYVTADPPSVPGRLRRRRRRTRARR